MCREMKICGIKWFGKIPGEWKIVKVKQLFNIGRGRVIPQTELDDNAIYPVYSSQTKNNGCLGYINTYDFDKKQLTWTTDGANAGTVFLRTGKYNCTNVCGTLLPKNEENNLEYLKYILEYTAIFHKRADTNGFKIMNNEMAEISILLPNKVEQDKIAAYLNRKVSQIDDIISKQKILIEKYKAYKQSLITETVTKGLNKNVHMKDSGIEWIGKIPNHWKLINLKLCTDKIGSGKTPLGGSEVYSSNGVMFLRSQNIYNEGIVVNDVVFISEEIDEAMKSTRVYENDILLNITGASIGRTAIYKYKWHANVNQHVCIIRCNSLILCEFMHYILISDIGKIETLRCQTGGNREGLTFEQIGNFRIPVLLVEEQQRIVDFLNKKCNVIDYSISKKEQLIEKLESYKKSLIYECVTGKREGN